MANRSDVFFPSDDDPHAHMDALALCRAEDGRIAESFDGPRFVGYTVTFGYDHPAGEPGAVEPEVEVEPDEPEAEVEPDEPEAPAAPKKAAPRKRAAAKK